MEDFIRIDSETLVAKQHIVAITKGQTNSIDLPRLVVVSQRCSSESTLRREYKLHPITHSSKVVSACNEIERNKYSTSKEAWDRLNVKTPFWTVLVVTGNTYKTNKNPAENYAVI